MKILLRLFFTFCALLCTELFAGSLKISLTPATVVAAGAQWKVDGGYWNPSGATVENLNPGNHTIQYSPVAGYVTPQSETVTLVSGVNPSLTRSYIPTASAPLWVTLNPSSAQWRIDGGAWLSSGASLYNLPPGAHTIDYSPVANYATPQSEIITLMSGSNPPLIRSYTPASLAASLKITLNPASAQWRIDGGAWTASGVTVSNLALGTHTVSYSTVANYATPQAEIISLVSGPNPSLTRSYISTSSSAALRITLSPAMAQWRIDGGAWMPSGVTVSNLPPGPHNLSYSPVPGYATPLPENINLISGSSQPAIGDPTRNYTPTSLAASLSISLNPSSALWRVDGGVWTSSGTVIGNLSPGTHTLNYSSADGYATPQSEVITLPSGSSTPLTRTYTPTSLAARVGTILSPSSALWRVDGGNWMSSDIGIGNLTPGLHTIDYSPVAGFATPQSETITLVGGFNPPLTRNYQPSSSAASLSIALNPSSALWRIDGGTWLSSGAILGNLAPGTHTISYSPVSGYAIPLSETITLASGTNPPLTRNYSSSTAIFSVTLNPSSAQWRVDGRDWRSSGATMGTLAPGPHTFEYAPLPGYVTPPSETITLGSGSNPMIFRAFAPLATLYVVLDPSWALWRIDGGPWLPSYTVLPNLSLGAHVIEYSPVSGYVTPPAETVTLISGPNPLNRNYTALATFSINLNPAYALWRLDGGNWTHGGVSLLDLPPGPHSVEYATMPGFITPPAETVTLISGPNPLNRSYTALATISVSLDPASAQWRLDDGAWNASGASLSNLTLGTHSVEYSAVTGFITPPAETVTLISGPNPLNRSYTALATISVSLDPASAQWRLDDGAWNTSGTSLSNLSLGTHAIEYSTVTGYITPPAESIVLASGSNPVSRAYAPEPPPYTTVKNFDDFINSPVTVADDNTLYGTTISGGNFGWGTIFKINQDGTGYSILHDFLDYGDGILPTGRLTKGNDGRLYGVTSQGNPAVGGTLFRIGNTAASYELIHSFGYNGDGSRPSGGVIQGSNGLLYGTTAAGGSHGKGTVYVTNPDDVWAYSIIHSFTDGVANDYDNYPTVTEGTDGRLYGTTSSGGSSYAGTIFVMSKDGTGYNILHHFGNQAGNGAYPNAALIQGSDGLFYGTTNYGGTDGAGTIFRLNPDGTGFSVIKNFLGGLADGSHPDHTGVVEKNGVLYGVTKHGGTFDAGVLYSIKTDGTDFQVLVNLGAGQGDGASPEASLTLTPEGILFGTTTHSGSGGGTLFRFQP